MSSNNRSAIIGSVVRYAVKVRNSLIIIFVYFDECVVCFDIFETMSLIYPIFVVYGGARPLTLFDYLTNIVCMTKQERIVLILLASLNFTHILDFMIMMPLGNYLMPYFHISPQEFSLLVSCYTLSAAMSGFVAAFYVDGFDRKKVLLTAYTGFLIGTIACGLSPTFYFLLIARTIAGIFGGVIGAQVLSIVADTFRYEKRGAAMGAIMSSFAIASTFGIPFGLYLANLISWHAPFLLIGVTGCVLIPVIMRYLPSMSGHLENQEDNQRSKRKVIMDILHDKSQYMALLFSGLVMFGHFITIPFINPFLEFNVGFSKNFSPLVYLFGGITSFFAANYLGKLSDQKGKLVIFRWSVLVALPLIFMLTNIPPTQAMIPVLILFNLWFMAGTGRGVTASAMVSNVVKPEQRGSFQSFNSSLQQLGSGMAALLAGFVVSKDPLTGKLVHYDRVGYISIGVLIVTIFLANRVFKKMESRAERNSERCSEPNVATINVASTSPYTSEPETVGSLPSFPK